MFRFLRLSLRAVCVLVAASACAETQLSDAADPPLDSARWIAELASDSYAVRQSAASKLLEVALTDPETEALVSRLLRREISLGDSGDLESQLACRRLLRQLTRLEQEEKLDRFLHDPSIQEDDLEGWPLFRKHAGDGNDARLVYRQIARLQLASALKSQPGLDRAMGQGEGRWAIEQIPPGDIARWAIVLAAVCESVDQNQPAETFRLDVALRRVDRGPMPIRSYDRRVVTALVSRYLATANVDLRDRLVIAKRYHCSEQVRADCEAILENPLAPASHVTTALLVASASDCMPAEIENWIGERLTDQRTSHVWQSGTPPKATYRTQVSDVAFALQLHRADIDPRSAGYRALLAHPILVYQPYSLGFQNESDRRLSRQRVIAVIE